jgi:hypothetical protein
VLLRLRRKVSRARCLSLVPTEAGLTYVQRHPPSPARCQEVRDPSHLRAPLTLVALALKPGPPATEHLRGVGGEEALV